MNDRLITVKDVGAALSCSRSTIWRRVKDGTIPAPIKICGLTRWRANDIAALMMPEAKPQARDRERSLNG